MASRLAAAARRSVRAVFAALALSAGVAPAALAVDTFTIRGDVVAGGGLIRAGSACFALSATSGQAAFFSGTSANFSIAPGYWRAHPPSPESLFASSFESCGP